MHDFRRLTFLGAFFLVVLRLGIGWHLFDQGLKKKQTMGTSQEWTAAGYLKNSRGPCRDFYRSLVDDPDDLNWLDYAWVNNRWTDWEKRFKETYGLTDDQQRQFDALMNGPQEILSRERLPEKPEGIRIGGSLAREKTIEMRRDSRGRWYLAVNGARHLIPAERDALLREADKVAKRYRTQGNQHQAELTRGFAKMVKDVYERNTRLGFRERLQALLKGDRERVGRIHEDQKGTVYEVRHGKVDDYRQRLKRRDEMLSGARTGFQYEHLEQEEARIRALHAELVGPVKALEKEMQFRARSLLNDTQLEKGTVPLETPDEKQGFELARATAEWMFRDGERPDGVIHLVDGVTMWALMILGGLLIVGFFSRTSAFLAAGLIFSFYLAMPPWPGIPQPPGPDSGLIVNKNLVEVLALLALAFIPTGKLFGIDTVFVGLFGGGRRTKRGINPQAMTMYPSGEGSAKSKKKGKRKSKTSLSPAERAVSETNEHKPQEPPPQQPAPSATPAAPSADTYTIRTPDRKT